MARKVVGNISREMNEAIDYRGPKTKSGAKLRSPRTINPPVSEGIGRYYKNDE